MIDGEVATVIISLHLPGLCLATGSEALLANSGTAVHAGATFSDTSSSMTSENRLLASLN